jgi:hypothetical protein
VGVGLEQGLVFVLAVDVDQQFAQRLEVAKRAGRAIDVAAAAAFGGDHPAQDARAVVVQVALGEPGMRFGNVHQVEGGEDVGLVGAGAHHAAVGAIAQGRPRASSMIDLPAPVSPVITLIPRSSSRSRCSTMA